MAITVYATVTDFIAQLPQTAWGARTVVDVQKSLSDASSIMDDYFGGRWPLPFATVPASFSVHCVVIARNLFMGGRGFSPVTGADETMIADLKRAEDWLDRVQRRALHPRVTIDVTATALPAQEPGSYQQPVALSQCPRGWEWGGGLP